MCTGEGVLFWDYSATWRMRMDDVQPAVHTS